MLRPTSSARLRPAVLTFLVLAFALTTISAPGAAATEPLPNFDLPGMAEYIGEQFVLDAVDQSGLGAGTRVTLRARTTGGRPVVGKAETDAQGRVTICLNTREVPEHTVVEVVIVPRSGGVWNKKIFIWRVGEESTATAVPWPWYRPADPNDNVQAGLCTCSECGGLCSTGLFTTSYEPQDHGVNLADGTAISHFPVASFDSRLLSFEFSLYHHSMTKYAGPVGQYMSHTYNMFIVQTGPDSGSIVTPDLRVFHIARLGPLPGDPKIEEWSLPEGFFSRLLRDQRLGRWILIHHQGCRFEFLSKSDGMPGPLLAISEPNGNRTSVNLDFSGLMSKVTTDLGQAVRFAYDEVGRLQGMTDHLGRAWSFAYQAAEGGEPHLTSITTPATEFADVAPGQETTDAHLPEVLVTRGRTTTLSYDDPVYPHHLTRITDERGAVPVEYTYYHDAVNAGRVATKRINGRDVSYSYDPPADAVPTPPALLESGNLVTRVTDREGNVTDFEVHGPFGGPVQGRGRYGLRRQVQWTERGKGGRPLRVGEPLYWERRWLHDCDCLVPRAVSQPFRADDSLQLDDTRMPVAYPTEALEYNDRRQVTAYEYRGFSPAERIRWEKTYDTFEAFSRELTSTEPRAFGDNAIDSGLGFAHTYAYDERGNRIRHQAPVVTRGVAAPQAITETWEYNALGQVTQHTDPNGNLTAYTYFTGPSAGGGINAQGEFGGYLASVTRGAAGSANPATSLTTRYKVNALGMVTQRIDPKGFAYDQEYNDLGETTREIEPAVTLRNGQTVRYETQYVYDGAGNRVMSRRSNVDADGGVPPNAFIDRSQSFDAVNNPLLSRVEVDGDDAHDLVTRYRYDRNDQLAVVEQPEGNRTFHVYDERRLRFETFYGIAPATNGDPSQGYPAKKGIRHLGGAPFVGFTASTYDARLNDVRNRDGRRNVTDHFYDFYNRRVATSDANGNGMVYEYDAASNVLTHSGGAVSKTTGKITALLERTYSRFDEAGRRYQTVLDVDLASDESAAINPDEGRNSSFLTRFDPGSRVVTSLDANGNPTHTAYDAADRTLSVTDVLGNVLSYRYDANSNVLAVEELEVPGPGATGGPERYVTGFTYDELNRRTESHVLGLNGNAIDHETFYAYDSRSNTRLVEDAEGKLTRLTFDDLDRVVLTQRFDGDPGASGVPAGVTELIHYEYRYDRNSRKTLDIALSDVGDPATAQATLYLYDDLDRLTTTVYPDADDHRQSADGPGYLAINLAGADGADGIYDRVEVGYDATSNVTSTREQRGVVFANRYDPGNRLTRQDIALPPDVPGTTRQEYEYDALNRLRDARNDYSAVERDYDPLSRLAHEGQAIRLDGSGFTRGYERPVDLFFAHDRQSNRTEVRVEDNTEFPTAGTRLDLETHHAFDALNRMTAIDAAYFDRPRHRIVDYAFLGPWRVQRKTFGNGAALTNVYDAKRRLAEHAWRDGTPQQNLLVGFQYDYDDVDNPLFERFLHDGGRYDNYGYNARYELTGVTYRSPAPADYRTFTGPFADTFDYDDNYNRRQASFGDPFDAEPNTNDTYAINKANEYTSIDRALGGQPAGTSPPLHDAAGNMTRFPTRPAAGGSAGKDVDLHATWDAFNLLFTATVPDPTLEGGHLVEHYRYDPFRRRIAKFSTSTGAPEGRLFIYDGWSDIEERVFDQPSTSTVSPNIADRLERIYIHGRVIDEPLLAAIDGDADRDLDDGPQPLLNTPSGTDFEYFYFTSRLASIMALLASDDASRVLGAYRYTIQGETTSALPVATTAQDSIFSFSHGPRALLATRSDRRQPGQILSPDNFYTFTARRSDFKTGIIYYRNRYYHAESSRFLTRDPIGYPESLNSYHYLLGNPCFSNDPLGLACCCKKIAVDKVGNSFKDFPACSGGGKALGWKSGGSLRSATGYANLRFQVEVNVEGEPADCKIYQGIKATVKWASSTDPLQKPSPKGYESEDYADDSPSSSWVKRAKGTIKWMDAPGLGPKRTDAKPGLSDNDLPAEFKAKFKMACTGTDKETLSVEWKMAFEVKSNVDAPDFANKSDNLPVSDPKQ